jgi:hypothetical protein
MCEYENHGGMILTGKDRRTRRCYCYNATISTTNPLWTAWARTRPFGERGRRPTAWAVARPFSLFRFIIPFFFSPPFLIFTCSSFFLSFTECRDGVVNCPASYSVDPEFNLGPDTDYRNWGFSWFSSYPASECLYCILKLFHDRFFPNNFQFIIIHLLLYILRFWNSVIKWLQTTHKFPLFLLSSHPRIFKICVSFQSPYLSCFSFPSVFHILLLQFFPCQEAEVEVMF